MLKGESFDALSNYLLLGEKDPIQALVYIEDCLEYMNRPPGFMTDDFEAPLVKLTSSLVFHRRLKLDQTKIASIKSRIDVHLAEFDFETEAALAKKDVNTWIEKQTQGKIKDLVGKISPDTLMIWTNTILNHLKMPFMW